MASKKDTKRKQESSAEESSFSTPQKMEEIGKSRDSRQKERVGSVKKKSRPSQSRERQTLLTQTFSSTVSETTNNQIFQKLENLQQTTETMKQQLEECHRSLAKQIDDKVELLTSAVFDVKKENEVLKATVAALQKQTEVLKEEICKLTVHSDQRKEELNLLEQYSRRESVRIHGIQDDNRNETAEECEKKVLRVVQSGLGLSDIDTHKISVLHRVGKINKDRPRPRPVIVKFISRKDRDRVLKARSRLKGSGMSVTEDLTHLNVQRLNRLKQHEGVLDAWSAAGGKLFVKLLDLSVREVKGGDVSYIDKMLIGMSHDEIVRQQREGSERKFQQNRERTTRQQQQQSEKKPHQQQPAHGREGHLGTAFSTFDPTTHSTPSVTKTPSLDPGASVFSPAQGQDTEQPNTTGMNITQEISYQ